MTRWNPWRALRRREQARLRFRSIHPSSGGGLVTVVNGQETIWLDHRLDRVERNAVLAHELIHLERGVPEAGCPDLLRDKEEALVRAETAQRLVPPDELQVWAETRAKLGPVTVVDICDEFGVPIDVAIEAVRHAA